MLTLSSSFRTESPEGHCVCVCVPAVTFLVWIEQPAARSAHGTVFPRQEVKQLHHFTEHGNACGTLLLEHLNSTSGIAWQRWHLQCFSGMQPLL